MKPPFKVNINHFRAAAILIWLTLQCWIKLQLWQCLVFWKLIFSKITVPSWQMTNMKVEENELLFYMVRPFLLYVVFTLQSSLWRKDMQIYPFLIFFPQCYSTYTSKLFCKILQKFSCFCVECLVQIFAKLHPLYYFMYKKSHKWNGVLANLYSGLTVQEEVAACSNERVKESMSFRYSAQHAYVFSPITYFL